MNESGKGVLALIGACTIWGLSALYYKQLAHVPPLEVLSHRTLWSFVFFGVVLIFQGRLRQVATLLSSRRQVLLVLVAAAMISINWFLFIFSIQIGRAVEASLGYYIFPLMAVLMGRVVLGEQMGGLKWFAVGIATCAVSILTYGLGVAPWISLTLAVTFALYGLLKKGSPAGPVVSVTAEVLLLSPLAVIWLWGVHNLGWTGLTGRNLGIFGHELKETLLLMGAGPLTATPLILFSYASKRVALGTVGVIQYLNPTLQATVATVFLLEPLTQWHMIAFPLIWVALAIYSLAAIRQERASRRAVII